MRNGATGGGGAGVRLVVLALFGTQGCFDTQEMDPTVEGLRIDIDDRGYVHRNEIGIQGAWYTYGDGYGDNTCEEAGMHDPAECSQIFLPNPMANAFPNDGGRMCTSGQVASAPPCKPNMDCPSGEPDFKNVWGAGIGFDLNTEPGSGSGAGGSSSTDKAPWDPLAHEVVGVSFQFKSLYAESELRVEFPMELPAGSDPRTTEKHPSGSPYWGADSEYRPSPVEEGYNHFHWTDVKPPKPEHYAFDASKILAIQFHVPSVTDQSPRQPYSFCVENLTFLFE